MLYTYVFEASKQERDGTDADGFIVAGLLAFFHQRFCYQRSI